MSEQKPFRVEVEIDADFDAVWRSLREAEEIGRWFGWDYEGLAEEIRFIFEEGSEVVERGRLRSLEGDQTIELERRGRRTVVRVVCPESLEGAGWDEIYDETEEGWRAFFEQLRFYLERHRGEERRTLFLAGDASGPELTAALDERAPGAVWHASRHQRGVLVEAGGAGLVIAKTQKPLAAEEISRANVLITAYGLDDERYGRLRSDWEPWWQGFAANTKVLPAAEATA